MALPPHLAKYAGFVELIAEAIWRDIEQETQTKTAASKDRAAVRAFNNAHCRTSVDQSAIDT